MNQKEKYKTVLGGFFTLCIIALFLILFFNFGSDMIYHQNSSTSVSEIYSKVPEKEYFSTERNFLMFGAQGATHFIDDTVYSITAKSHITTRTGVSIFPLELEKCTEDHLPSKPNLREYFLSASNSPLDRLFCIKNLDDLYIEGSFDAEVFSKVLIEVSICKNQTDNATAPVCKSKEEIARKISYFGFYGVDYLIDPQNFDSPGQAIGKDYFTPIAMGTTRFTSRYISSTKFNSDDGFLFSTKTEYQYPTLAENKEVFLMDSSDSGALFFLEI